MNLKYVLLLSIIPAIPAVALAQEANPPVNAPQANAQQQSLKAAPKVRSLNNLKVQGTDTGKIVLNHLLNERPDATFAFVDEMNQWYKIEQKTPIAPDRSVPKYLVHPVLGSVHGSDGLAAFYRDIDLFNTDVDPRILAEFSAYALGPASVYSNEYEYNHNVGVKIYVRPPKIKREKDKITFRFNTLCAPPGDGGKKLIFHTVEVTPNYEVNHQSTTEPIQLVEIKGHPRKPIESPKIDKK
ncbi:MAG: hypothetical protein IJU23_07735 [Proteobacteria bacterium]|nr:hypothetical protein [Pseudomonadota bacterium]